VYVRIDNNLDFYIKELDAPSFLDLKLAEKGRSSYVNDEGKRVHLVDTRTLRKKGLMYIKRSSFVQDKNDVYLLSINYLKKYRGTYGDKKDIIDFSYRIIPQKIKNNGNLVKLDRFDSRASCGVQSLGYTPNIFFKDRVALFRVERIQDTKTAEIRRKFMRVRDLAGSDRKSVVNYKKTGKETYFYKDSQNIYFESNILENVDINSFELKAYPRLKKMWGGNKYSIQDYFFSRDKNNIFWKNYNFKKIFKICSETKALYEYKIGFSTVKNFELKQYVKKQTVNYGFNLKLERANFCGDVDDMYFRRCMKLNTNDLTPQNICDLEY
jgi:hypothetical protein